MFAFGTPLLPFLIWNALNGWATFHYWAGYTANQGVAGSPLDFLINQILIMNPLSAAPVDGGAVVRLLQAWGALQGVRVGLSHPLRPLHRERRVKSYFLALGDPPLFAGGAMQIAALRVRWPRLGSSMEGRAYAVVLTPGGVLLAPGCDAGIASGPNMPRVYHSSGSGGANQDSGDVYGLPQSLADRFGWEQSGGVDRAGLSQLAT